MAWSAACAQQAVWVYKGVTEEECHGTIHARYRFGKDHIPSGFHAATLNVVSAKFA
jgi:hypothetical protein